MEQSQIDPVVIVGSIIAIIVVLFIIVLVIVIVLVMLVSRRCRTDSSQLQGKEKRYSRE